MSWFGRVRCGDGVWRALDSRALHRQLKPAGMVYQAALRVELTARLGVHWGPVDRHGQADIDGVPTELTRLFSKRTAQIEPRAAELIAEAGTGKSHTMGAAAHAWAASSIPVRGLAVSAAAAGVLHAETGIGSDTVAKFLHEHDRPGGPGPGWRLQAGEVLVVDESSMVASADLARLVVLADEAGGKVALVGDWAQLGAVEAGGLFRLLAQDHNVELTGVRRFHHAWERAASLELRDRAPTALAVYEDHGRVVGGDRATILAEAFARWQQARVAGESVVVCASDHATVDDLAARCRAARVETGDVEPGGVPARGHVVGVGDEIVTTRNDRRLLTTGNGWVRNGDRWHIDARHPDGSLTVTVHKAQGLTVDQAVLIADDATTAEALYVGMTRGRHAITALVVTDTADLDHTRHRGTNGARGAHRRPTTGLG